MQKRLRIRRLDVGSGRDNDPAPKCIRRRLAPGRPHGRRSPWVGVIGTEDPSTGILWGGMFPSEWESPCEGRGESATGQRAADPRDQRPASGPIPIWGAEPRRDHCQDHGSPGIDRYLHQSRSDSLLESESPHSQSWYRWSTILNSATKISSHTRANRTTRTKPAAAVAALKIPIRMP